MWYIVIRTRSMFNDDLAELIDIFMRRGEDINAQCGPIGTALHSALLDVEPHPWFFRKLELLIAKGANVNASGPLGTPLEFLWRLANTKASLGSVEDLKKAIHWLMERGAVNNRCDPNGSIPSRERMLSFGAGGMKGVEKSRAWYRGNPIEDGSSIVTQTANS